MSTFSRVVKAGLLLLLINTNSYSYEVGRINYKLYGEVVRYTCGIDISNADKYVDLGRWSARQIIYSGHGYTNFVPFEFMLSDCPPNSNIFFTFIGKADDIDPELLAIESGSDSAKNVGIELADSKGKRIPIGIPYLSAQSGENGEVSVTFKARYRATQPDPTVGKANSDVTFVITYD